MTRLGNRTFYPSYSARFNAAVSRLSPPAAGLVPRRRKRKATRMSRAQKRIVVSLWKSNRKMAAALVEKDQVIAWLSGCYSVNAYRDD